MSETNRNPRETDTRVQDSREELSWTPPALLPEPVQDPDYVYRWIRVSAMGQDDPMNVNSKRREGYEPVLAKDQPHIAAMSNPRSPYKEAIEIGGLLLCRAPRKLIEQRRRHYQSITAAQQASVDRELMKQNDARMPLFRESKSKTSFGKGE